MPSRIIVIEDEPVIALEIEEAVVAAACDVVGNAHTVAQALSLLGSVPCDGVILDSNLAGESAEPIVERLKADNVPYIVVSGYVRSQLDFLDDAVVLIGKPFSFDKLIAAVREHLSGTDHRP